MIIGVTGKSGVGKTTFINSLKSKMIDTNVIIVDEFVKNLIKNDSFYQQLLFYLAGSNNINDIRTALFEDSKKMSLVKSYIEPLLKSKIFMSRYEHIIVEAANLHEFKSVRIDKRIILVCDEEERQNRLITRVGSLAAEQIIEFQKDLTFPVDSNTMIVDTSEPYDISLIVDILLGKGQEW